MIDPIKLEQEIKQTEETLEKLDKILENTKHGIAINEFVLEKLREELKQ